MTDDIGHAELGDRVLKRDALGRVMTDAARRDAILDEFERSALSGVKFAAVTGIKGATTKVCTTSRFGMRPSQNQGFQRRE